MQSAVSNARFIRTDSDPAAALLRDLRDGLRYTHEGEEKTLSWRTTYLDLERMPIAIQSSHDRFGWEVYHFEIPMRLGTLEIGGLQINVPDPSRMSGYRLDTPLDCFPFEVRLDGDGAENYWKLKAYLTPVLGEPVNIWEREDEMHVDWDADGLQIGLTYWFKSYISANESGYASLNINNQRIFPEYFTDDYVTGFAVDRPGLEIHTFEVPHCTVANHYRNSQWVRFTPEPIRELLRQENRTLAVWHDPQHGKLGFAKDEPFCMLLEVNDHQRFTLEIIDHDRGNYSHEIRMVRPDGSGEQILQAGVGALAEVVEVLEKTHSVTTNS